MQDFSNGLTQIIDKQLILVGNGPWAKKVEIGLLKSKYISTRISARKFAERGAITKKMTCKKYTNYWICTRPDLQLEIARKLDRKGNKVILEKPVATSSCEWEQLIDLLKTAKAHFYISQPWCESSIWQETREILSTCKKITKIQIKRTGSTSRIYTTVKQDWLPHDLSLLQSLNMIDPSKTALSNHYISSTKETFQIDNPERIEIIVELTKGDERTSVWIFTDENGKELETNLLSQEIRLRDEVGEHLKKYYFNENSLEMMVDKILTGQTIPLDSNSIQLQKFCI